MTKPGAPYKITYSTRDKAGNVATPVTRTVAVVDPCLDAAAEFTCPGSLAGGVAGRVCSVGRNCPDASQLVSAAAEMTPSAGVADPPQVFEPAADVTPPVIYLLPRTGEGLFRTVIAGGIVVDTVTVNVGTPFTDPGVEAYDAEDGNLTSAVTSWGSGNIDTTITTAPGLPFIIEYSVVDSAGNTATVARRRVRVVNPCANAPRWGGCKL